MANPIIYDGSPGPISGSTPFGFYDNDPEYQNDGPKVANYCARKLGYPVLDVELDDLNIYACFEEAVSIYAEELYQLKIKDNYLTLEGQPTASLLNNTVVSPNLTNMVNIAETYGQVAGVGGFVSWKSGSLDLLPGQQNYNVYDWAVASQSMDPGDRIIIQRIMYQAPPVRLPEWSFELIGTNLRITPVPLGGNYGGYRQCVSIQYAFQSDLMSLTENSPYGSNQGLVANPALAPYGLITYSDINQPGKQWIKEYTAALTSELLGLIRGKYQTVLIPGAEATLNYNDLITRGKEMQVALREKLRTDLEDMSRQKQLERKQSENNSLSDTLNNIPLMVYIG